MYGMSTPSWTPNRLLCIITTGGLRRMLTTHTLHDDRLVRSAVGCHRMIAWIPWYFPIFFPYSSQVRRLLGDPYQLLSSVNQFINTSSLAVSQFYFFYLFIFFFISASFLFQQFFREVISNFIGNWYF